MPRVGDAVPKRSPRQEAKNAVNLGTDAVEMVPLETRLDAKGRSPSKRPGRHARHSSPSIEFIIENPLGRFGSAAKRSKNKRVSKGDILRSQFRASHSEAKA